MNILASELNWLQMLPREVADVWIIDNYWYVRMQDDLEKEGFQPFLIENKML